MKIRVVKTSVKCARAFFICFFAIIGVSTLTLFVVLAVGKVQNALALQKASFASTKTVIIDPGHGGLDGGAVGYGGVVEKNINLAVSLKLRGLFEVSGYHVIMTRQDDRSIYDEDSDTIREKKTTDIHNRSKLLEQNPDALFVSIHQNKFEQSQYCGTQVFYSGNNDQSKLLAQSIQTNVRGMLQKDNDRQIKPAGKNLYILYHAKTPAVMVECGFLSNPQESVLLQDSKYQDKMAFAIYCGILKYYSGSNTSAG